MALGELRSVRFVRWWSDGSSSGFGVVEAVGGSSGSVVDVFAAVLWWSGKLFAVYRCLFCFFLFCVFFFVFCSEELQLVVVYSGSCLVNLKSGFSRFKIWSSKF